MAGAAIGWPPLKVNMLLKTARTALVRINNSEFHEGDVVDGVRIVDIQMETVASNYNGETRQFKSGQTTSD